MPGYKAITLIWSIFIGQNRWPSLGNYRRKMASKKTLCVWFIRPFKANLTSQTGLALHLGAKYFQIS